MFLVVLGLAGFMYAQSSTDLSQSPANSSMKLSGTVCQESCVSSVGGSNLPTCDPLCTSKGGQAVLVDDSGSIHKIANQDMCKSHMGKHVKMMAMPMTPTEKEREETLRVMELHDDPGGGF
jgi:hypothetical protein